MSVLAGAGRRPEEVHRIPPERLAGLEPTYVVQRGPVLYVALGNFFARTGARAGLATVRVRDPTEPEILSLWTSGRRLSGSAIVRVKGRYAYLGAMTEGVFVLDISNRRRIRRVSSFQPDVDFPRPDPSASQHPNARGLAVRGNLLYVAYDAGGVRVLDVTDKEAPREVGRYLNPGAAHTQQAYNNLVLDWPLAYVAVDYCGLEILDVRDPERIRRLGWWNPWGCESLQNLWLNSPGHTNQLSVDRRRELVYVSAGDSELQVVDVSDPAEPRRAAKLGKPGNDQGVWGLTRSKRKLYLAYIETLIPFRGTWAGIEAVRVRRPSSLGPG